MSRVAVVVPVLRLRRDTAGWSYRIPAGTPCLPGTLVIIPFRNRPTLGVVWEQRDDDLASHQISQILTAQPLVLAPHRQLIEYLAEAGLCSLSTALYVWLPRWMRRLPLTRSVQLQLMQPITANNTSQRAVILPGRRPVQEGLLSNQSTELLFSDTSEAQTERAFWRIANGSALLGVGKDGAVFAPWRNLQQLVIIDPEDISYYREQVPYLSLLGALEELARANRIKPQWRSQLPTAAAQALWGSGAKGNDQLPDLIGHIDLRHEPAFGDVTLSLIQETLARGQKVLILYNTYDHLGEPMPDGRRKSVAGVQGLSRELARKLGLSELPESVVLGTRLILQRPYEQVGLTIALNLDQLLQTPLFADQLHGWSDLGRRTSPSIPGIERQASAMTICLNECHVMRGLTKAVKGMVSPSSSGSCISTTISAKPWPTCGAARPIPIALCIVARISAASCVNESSKTVMVNAFWRRMPAGSIRIGRIIWPYNSRLSNSLGGSIQMMCQGLRCTFQGLGRATSACRMSEGSRSPSGAVSIRWVNSCFRQLPSNG